MSWRKWAGIGAVVIGVYLAWAEGGGWYPFSKLQAIQTPSPAHLALPPPPTPVPITPVPTTPAPTVREFEAQLDGEQEVPPRTTEATGKATFEVRDETELDFSLNVFDIQNIIAVHLHCAPAGENGPVGVTLFGPVAPGGGAVDTFSAGGSITAPDTDNECGWADVAAVVDAVRSGNAYVNVHTDDGVDPPDSGPGDFPGGEIRGQIEQTGS